MQKVIIQTSQNVFIEYELASVGDRILAALLDYLVMFAYIVVIIIVATSVELDFNTTYFVIFYIPIFFYHFICEISFNGQSFGKKQMNIKVVKLDGTQPTLGSYLFRWLIKPIDIFFYGGVAILTIIISGKGQRLGDIPAGTTVIRLKNRVSLSDRTLPGIQENYIPVYPEVTRLSDRDIEIIKEVIFTYQQNRNRKPVDLLTAKTLEFLNVKTDLPPLKFLQQVVLDYTNLTHAG